jgi:hypothetical protein
MSKNNIVRASYSAANNYANVVVEVTPDGKEYKNWGSQTQQIDKNAELTISMNGKASMTFEQFHNLYMNVRAKMYPNEKL